MKDGKFKLGEKDVKMKWSARHERGTKEKIWVPDRIGTYDLPNTGRALYPLELRRINGERGHILGSSFKRVLHTTRILFTFVSPSVTFTIFHFFHHTVLILEVCRTSDKYEPSSNSLSVPHIPFNRKTLMETIKSTNVYCYGPPKTVRFFK